MLKQINNLQFGDFTLDLYLRELRRGDTVLPVQGKAFDLLSFMAANPGRPLSKAELLDAVWPDTAVEESNLTQHVFQLRKVMASGADGPIKTLTGRGYQFVAEVTEIEAVPKPKPAPAPSPLLRVEATATRVVVQQSVEEESELVAATLAPALADDLPSPGGEGAARIPRRKYLLWALLTASAVLALAAIALALLLRPSRPRVLDEVQLTNDGVPKHFNAARSAIVSDGSRLIFTERRDNQSRIAEVPVEGGEVRSMPAPMADAMVTDYSRVNRTMIIGSSWRTDDERPILTESPPGTKPMQIGELIGHEAVWSPDARSIAVARSRFLYVANADGSNERRLVSANGILYALRWSPDGRTIGFSENLGGNENHLWAVDVTGANLHRLMDETADGNHLCCGVWSADGRNFFYIVQGIVANSIWVSPLTEPKSIFRSPRSTRLTPGLSDYWQTPLPGQDGRSLWAIGSHVRGELTMVDPATRELRPFLGGISAEGASFSPAASKDGSWVAYTEYPEGTLWRSRPDGSEKQQLTRSPLVARFPQWSPDGRTIAFLGGQSGAPWRIYLVSAAGGNPEPMLVENASQGVPSWSPDGKRIAFGRLLDYGNERDPNLTIEIYDLEHHSHKTLHGSEGLWTARWSPDGRYLSAVTEDNRVLRLYDMQTRQWSDLANVGVNDVIWSRDSRYLYFDALYGGDPALYRIPIDTRNLERWASLRGFPRGGFYSPWLGIAPDGAPLLLKDTSIEEVYRLDLDTAN